MYVRIFNGQFHNNRVPLYSSDDGNYDLFRLRSEVFVWFLVHFASLRAYRA